MKTGKKILCSFLVALMVLTSAPLGGFVGLEMPDFLMPSQLKSQRTNISQAAIVVTPPMAAQLKI